LAGIGKQVRHNQLRDQIMRATECSKRTAQLAIQEACLKGGIVQDIGLNDFNTNSPEGIKLL
jgi:hypothetical protein